MLGTISRNALIVAVLCTELEQWPVALWYHWRAGLVQIMIKVKDSKRVCDSGVAAPGCEHDLFEDPVGQFALNEEQGTSYQGSRWRGTGPGFERNHEATSPTRRWTGAGRDGPDHGVQWHCGCGWQSEMLVPDEYWIDVVGN